MFVVWAGVFYRLASLSARAFLDRAVWALCGVAAVDYMFFGKNLGILTAELKYEQGFASPPSRWKGIRILSFKTTYRSGACINMLKDTKRIALLSVSIS